MSGKIQPHGSLSEYESNAVIEQEADQFASHLLMPSLRFISVAQSVQLGLEGIRKIANHFGTSITASAVRYVKQELVPCALLKWKDNELEWKWLSTEMFRAKFRSTIRSIAELPDESATCEVVNMSIKTTEVVRKGSTASTWFRYISSDSLRNVILIEEVMSLGRFGALTFLYPAS